MSTLTKKEKRKLYRQLVKRYEHRHGRRPNRATIRRQLKTYLDLHVQEDPRRNPE